MKRLLTAITVFALIILASSAFAQGQVNFENGSSTLVSTNNWFIGGTGLMSGPGGTYQFGLFWAPTTVNDPREFQFSGRYGTNLTTAGKFAGGSGAAAAPAIAGQAIGTSVHVLFRGWSADPGLGTPVNGDATVWNRVAETMEYSGGYGVGKWWPRWDWVWLYGESGIGTVVLGGGITPIVDPFGSIEGRISTGFTLSVTPVPEPATGALLLLGAAALLRRRNR